ncbi:hypothetical protein C8J57DRAFT_1252429 [Mycena rebaudengoi]|nr:hypothetical protein C8J57DRAFT_1252429 [Mycena rebaudengoi]
MQVQQRNSGSAQRALFATYPGIIDDSDAEGQPSKHTDQDSLDELILGTIEPTAPRQSKRQRSASNSSNSATPCPINCHGCGEISEGDDGPEQVQCSSCGFWSHFRCQPEDGEVDWNDPNIGMIRYPAIHLSPAENNPLIQVFDAALAPLAKLLVSFPDDHPVVSSYKLFFTDLATEDNDSLVTRVEEWIAPPLFEPVKEVADLMVRPLKQLQNFRLVSVPGPERHRRVLTVGRGDIKRINIEADEALLAMLVATKPKVLTHKRYWDSAAFQQLVGNFTNDHTALDPPYRPKTYRRNRPLEPRRPPIAITIDIPRSIEDDEIMPPRTRPRKDSEDTPTPKHQATSRSLRPRGNRGPRKEQVAAVPVSMVVASGKGWITIDVDNSDD